MKYSDEISAVPTKLSEKHFNNTKNEDLGISACATNPRQNVHFIDHILLRRKTFQKQPLTTHRKKGTQNAKVGP